MAIGSLAVRVSSDTTQFNKGMKTAGGQAKQLGREAGQLGKKAAMMSAALAAAGAAIAVNLTVKGLAAVDAQAKLARQLGGTIDGLRGLQIAGSDAGVEAGALGSAMEKLNSRLGEATQGSGEAFDALKRLGLSAKELGEMDVDERMATIADRMQSMGLSTQVASDELRNLGIRQSEVTNLMLQGGDAIRSARGEVEELGLSLSAVDAAKVEQANDAFSRMGMLTEGLQQKLAVAAAPFVTAISDSLVEASKEAGDLSEVIDKSFQFVINASAFVADAIEGIRRTFTLAGQSIAVVALGMQEVIISIGEAIASGPIDALNELIRIANNIPVIDFGEVKQFDFVTNMQSQLQEAKGAVDAGMAAMQATLMEPMPSEGIKQWAEEVKVKADQAAKDMAEAMSNQGQGDEGGETGQGGGEGGTDESAREKMQKNLERIREGHLTELELLEQKLEQENELINNALEQKLITEEEWNQLSQQQKESHEQSLTDIEEQESNRRKRLSEVEARAKQQAMGNMFSNLSTLMNTESKKMFKIGKAAALAGALIDGYAAIVGAYKVGASIGGPALGAAYGAAAGAATFANINAIRSQSMGGGGGGGGKSPTAQINENQGGVNSQGGSQEPSERLVANLSVTGQNFDRRTVIGLAEQMAELSEDGVRFRVNS